MSQVRYAKPKRLIRALFEEQPSGGYLHVVVEDLNVEDRFLRRCISDSSREIFGRMPTEAEMRAYIALLDLSERERILVIRDAYKVLGNDGY